MNKNELVSSMAEKTGMKKTEMEKALKAFTDTVVEALKNDDKIQLVGFGTFEVNKKPARTGRNPKDGSTIQIPASKSPKFKAGKVLKDAVKNA